MAQRRSELSGNGGMVEIIKHFPRSNRFRNHQNYEIISFSSHIYCCSIYGLIKNASGKELSLRCSTFVRPKRNENIQFPASFPLYDTPSNQMNTYFFASASFTEQIIVVRSRQKARATVTYQAVIHT